MVIKYGKLGNILTALMYRDRMTVQRFKDGEVNPDGSQSSDLLSSFLQDEPCLVHETKRDSPEGDDKDVARQEVRLMVFCSSKCDIHTGDILTLSILDDDGNVRKVIEGYAGQPTYYPDHLEIWMYDWKVQPSGIGGVQNG